MRVTQHRNREGEALFAEACRKGWEGLIAKRADSPYASKRSRDWLKFKCDRAQELVIGGYTAPKGSREELGALLLGYHSDGDLLYAGKVGTGFGRETLRDLAGGSRRFTETRRRSRTPADIKEREVTWVGARAGRPGGLHGMDPRRPPAPPALPRAAVRQAGVRGGARGMTEHAEGRSPAA